MSALAADALAGLAVATASTTAEASGAAVPLTRALAGLGAEHVESDAPADLVIVAIDGGNRPAGQADAKRSAHPSSGRAAPSLDAAADGALAAAITAAFGAAREAHPLLRPGGCLLLVLANAAAGHADIDPARAALGSLTRTLALEWAPDHRVNALVCAAPRDAAEAAALIAWPASRTLTGAVLDVVEMEPG